MSESQYESIMNAIQQVNRKVDKVEAKFENVNAKIDNLQRIQDLLFSKIGLYICMATLFLTTIIFAVACSLK